MSDEELNKMMTDEKAGWWPEPMTLIFGKATVPTERTAGVFAQTKPGNSGRMEKRPAIAEPQERSDPRAKLAGPWLYYRQFQPQHGLLVPQAKLPEIEVKSGVTLNIPIVLTHSPNETVELLVTAPNGWRVLSAGRLLLPAENKTAVNVEIATPELTKEQLKNAQPDEIVIGVRDGGTTGDQVRLRVLLKTSALAQ